MRIYISGRIKDYAEHRDHFKRGVDFVKENGHEPVDPCDLGYPGMTYDQFMRVDLRALLDCDAIYMLDGWEQSVGARIEHQVAAVCGLNVYYETHYGIPR